ncbi:hypothetical protein BU17DRAFT_74216 [Hysterangium stoloniferum]|nr:hypothetical protein BU17DRAFT_74216 [Hysterangium stoloniferum]
MNNRIKPPLLTAQQKKANHIQSEQKRRANIRRGYEALCETIPALREAIRTEEEASSSGTPGTGGGGGSGSGSGSGSGRKRRMKDEGAEKMDGRAGPRSENVVLQKTIEHIQGLLDEKAALTSRLEHVCSVLGPGHPALHPNASLPPLWEREWDGGQGLMVDTNGEVFRDSDEE